MGRLEGKVAVILGASDPASMGAATARRFAAEGAKLVLAARRLEGVRAVAEPLGALALACDITREEDLARLADAAVEAHGGLDVAVNCAGVSVAAPLDEVTREQLMLSCEVHLVGTALFFKQMARRMARGGSLITISSLTAYAAPRGYAAYAGAKRGADQVVRIAAQEYGPRGIKVNAIAPGFTRSAMTEGYFAVPSIAAAFVKEIPLRRLGTVEDVANAALWLASDESFLSGQVLDITGGQTLNRTPTEEEMMGALAPAANQEE
ncbi:MAG: short-chain dehydrogenase [Porticoccaceae bacterium]|nr:MAG: short-chain dehydrogenase [Porticoccaceae bacterium]